MKTNLFKNIDFKTERLKYLDLRKKELEAEYYLYLLNIREKNEKSEIFFKIKKGY